MVVGTEVLPCYVNRARMIPLSPHFTPAMIEHGGEQGRFLCIAGLLVVAHLLITNRGASFSFERGPAIVCGI